MSAALIAGVVLLFAIASLDARADRRSAAEQRFQDEAAVTASVIQSAFASGVPAQTEQYAQDFGSATVDTDKLDALARKSKLTFAAVLDARGELIGSTSDLDPGVAAALAERPMHVSSVLEGAPFAISGIVSETNAEYVSAFDAADGKRVMVQGFPVELIAAFVGGTLAQLPNAEREQAYVLDTRGQVIASAEPDVQPGSPAPKLDDEREETEAAVANTAWSVVLSASSSDLYAGVESPVQWLILVALGLAGVIALFLLARTMRTTAELAGAYAELERSNADLARTNTELQRSNSELEQFASVASHDLQEPLRKVQTFGDQLERRHGEDLNDEAKDYLRRMRNASARMSVLIDDLLRFSRVTTHAKPHVAVDLDRVARDVVQDLEARVEETRGRVDLGPLPTVLADPMQMRQLLQNLIGNALKFHHPDVPPVVRLETVPAPREDTVAFVVADNGIGFEPEYTDRIFRVFERLHPRDVYAGTGIGLALCRKIAERHGGSIEGESTPGSGATFTVVLPAAPSGVADQAPAAAPEPAHV